MEGLATAQTKGLLRLTLFIGLLGRVKRIGGIDAVAMLFCVFPAWNLGYKQTSSLVIPAGLQCFSVAYKLSNRYTSIEIYTHTTLTVVIPVK